VGRSKSCGGGMAEDSQMSYCYGGQPEASLISNVFYARQLCGHCAAWLGICSCLQLPTSISSIC
jgi:hypothetical protein